MAITLRGTAPAAALPESEKSARRTVMRSEGVNPKSFRSKASAFRNARAVWGTRYDCDPSK